MPHVTVLGDALLDVDVLGTADRVGPEGCLVLDAHDERRRPGAAALAAMFAAADDAAVRLVTALGDDDAGRWLAGQLADAGVEVVDLGLGGPTPQKWRFRGNDGTVVRVDRHCRDLAPIGAVVGRRLGGTDAVLVSDYGRGVAAAMVEAVARMARTAPVVWDPHPRGIAPPGGLDLVTPNEGEARQMAPAAGGSRESLAHALAVSLRATVAVTCGADGAVVADGTGSPLAVPARPALGDTCGAGDRLAARATVARAGGAPPVAAVVEGVDAASRYVAGAAPAAPGRGTGRDPFALAAATRAGGGRVVVAGGCFDLLHAGHVELLQAARALGDCLIVCLNSNRSIRRLKGTGRPIVDEADRRRILEALDCVDAVAVFDEPTPIAVLERLRPHVFAKGADYDADRLPERAVLETWGGTVAILPLAGARSTSNLIQLVREQAS